MWETAFLAVSIVAMIAWVILILLPRKPFLMAAVLYLGAGLLSFIYTAVLIALLANWVDGVALNGGAAGGVDFTTIVGVAAIFASKGGVVVGWTHYLAFDLFVGLWIARDADAKEFNRFVQAPILFATFMVGPVGLFIWLIVRERRARKSGRWE